MQVFYGSRQPCITFSPTQHFSYFTHLEVSSLIFLPHIVNFILLSFPSIRGHSQLSTYSFGKLFNRGVYYYLFISTPKYQSILILFAFPTSLTGSFQQLSILLSFRFHSQDYLSMDIMWSVCLRVLFYYYLFTFKFGVALEARDAILFQSLVPKASLIEIAIAEQ